MNKISLFNLLLLFLAQTASAQSNCLTSGNLIKLDAAWEQAQLELDIEFIESLLTDNFIWVHNHANTIDDKTAVTARIQRYISANEEYSKSRISEGVRATISDKTGIVTGFTKVDNGAKVTTYHFMRTYIKKDEKCILIANQTMAIPEEE